MANPIEIIKQDHEQVKQLFAQYNALREGDEHKKSELAGDILKALTVHAKMEEKYFYSRLKEAISEEHPLPLDEAQAEHHAAKMIMMELKMMPVTSETYDAKMTVLEENITHHIEEEETEILPHAEAMLGERFEETGREMEEYREDAKKSVLDKLFGE